MAGDQELVTLLKAGDADALEQLIARWRPGAEAYACSLLHDSQAAEDAVQEAFARLYAVRTDIDERRSFSAYLYTIVKRICLDELRKRKNSYGHEDIDEQYDLADTGPGTEAQILKKERQKAVTDAIRQLPEEARNIIILREFQGLSYEELADVLDLEPGTVKSRLNRAKQKLKEILLESLEQNSIWDV